MCIVLYSIGEGDKKELVDKSVLFAKNKKADKFLLCYYILEDNIPRWLKRKRVIFREVLRQAKDSSYSPYSEKECSCLWDKDKNQILKLVSLAYSLNDKKEVINHFENAYQETERRINEFLKGYIDEFVIPVSEIDFELKSHLMSFLNLGNPIKNDSDARTIASAIQEHKNQELIILTSDKKDWNKGLLEEVNNHMNLKKKYPKLPEIKYIQNY